MAVVLIDGVSGDRTILQCRHRDLTLEPGDVDASIVQTGRLLLVDASSIAASTHAARLARAAGMPTMIDVDAPAEGLEALLQAIDVLIVSAGFPRALTGLSGVGEALGALAARFHSAVAVVTLGPEGSLTRCGAREIRTRAPAVAARDTTGAGDAFRGGFAAAWLEAGDGADLERVLTIANVVAALNCREVGAQTGLPGREELARFL
jgi:sugar/nucleoside kinase (ribokinase family)